MRRTRHEIQAGILKSCVLNGLTISQLMALQNLSYKALKPTLDHLSMGHLIEFERERNRKIVRTTDRGLIALKAFETALQLLDGRQGPGSLQLAARSMAESMMIHRKIIIEQ